MLEVKSTPRPRATGDRLASEASAEVADSVTARPRRTALIVDDFSLLAGALAERVALDGYVTTIAGNAAEASDLCSTGRYDLVMVDWSLPDGDGLDVAHLARFHNPSAFVVLMSGFAVSSRDRRLRGTVNGVLCKPWRPGELQALLERAAGAPGARPRRRKHRPADPQTGASPDMA